MDQMNQLTTLLQAVAQETMKVTKYRADAASYTASVDIANMNADFLSRVNSARPGERLDPTKWEEALNDHFEKVDEYIGAVPFALSRQAITDNTNMVKAKMKVDLALVMNERLMNDTLADYSEDRSKILNGNTSVVEKANSLFGKGTGWYDKMDALGFADPTKLAEMRESDRRALAVESFKARARGMGDPEEAQAWMANPDNSSYTLPDGSTYRISDTDRQNIAGLVGNDISAASKARLTDFQQFFTATVQKDDGVVNVPGMEAMIDGIKGMAESEKVAAKGFVYSKDADSMVRTYDDRISFADYDAKKLGSIKSELTDPKKDSGRWANADGNARERLIDRIDLKLSAIARAEASEGANGSAADMARSANRDANQLIQDYEEQTFNPEFGRAMTVYETLAALDMVNVKYGGMASDDLEKKKDDLLKWVPIEAQAAWKTITSLKFVTEDPAFVKKYGKNGAAMMEISNDMAFRFDQFMRDNPKASPEKFNKFIQDEKDIWIGKNLELIREANIGEDGVGSGNINNIMSMIGGAVQEGKLATSVNILGDGKASVSSAVAGKLEAQSLWERKKLLDDYGIDGDLAGSRDEDGNLSWRDGKGITYKATYGKKGIEGVTKTTPEIPGKRGSSITEPIQSKSQKATEAKGKVAETTVSFSEGLKKKVTSTNPAGRSKEIQAMLDSGKVTRESLKAEGFNLSDGTYSIQGRVIYSFTPIK